MSASKEAVSDEIHIDTETAAAGLRANVPVRVRTIISDRAGSPIAVMLSPEEFRAMNAFNELAHDPVRSSKYSERAEQINRGESVTLDQFFSPKR